MVWTLLWTWNLPESAFTARCGTRDQPKNGPQNCAKGGGEGYSAMASHLALKLVCVWTITCLGSGHDVHRAPLLHDRWTCIDNEIPSRMGSLAVQGTHKRSFPSEHLKISICRWFRMISTDFHEYEVPRLPRHWSFRLFSDGIRAPLALILRCKLCKHANLSQWPIPGTRPRFSRRGPNGPSAKEFRSVGRIPGMIPGMTSMKWDDAKCYPVTWLCLGDQQSTS